MQINYQSLIDEAMLGIIRKILFNLQDNGLDNDQYFYISFRTNHPGTVLSKRVKQNYPEEITIILQHEYKNLQVVEDKFSVDISFYNILETVEVPFSALTKFSDQSKNFCIQFGNDEKTVLESDMENEITNLKQNLNLIEKNKKNEPNKVIAIDEFRKKRK